jgi:predicted nuclease of restriction endonuclease-like RecB superfamily
MEGNATATAEELEQAPEQTEVSFMLDASEEKLLEEFGTLMSAEYNYID